MMDNSKGHSNAQSRFGVHQISRGNHIRDLQEPVKAECVFAVCEEILQLLEQQGQLTTSARWMAVSISVQAQFTVPSVPLGA